MPHAIYIIKIETSSRWHSIMDNFDGSTRDDEDDNVMVLTPMSQPVGDRITFPPNARASIWSYIIKLNTT